MTIRLIDSDLASKILTNRRGTGMILSALNLFMLGFLKQYPKFPQQALFWCDGLMGVNFIRAKGASLKQLRGVKMLEAIVAAHHGCKVSILGTCGDAAREFLQMKDIWLSDHYSLDSVNLDNFDATRVVLTTDIVIITLPSPKQELLALKLSSNPENANVHFYCIGGALNMMLSPELDCPRVLQRLGLEFAFRLRTDTWRRLRRLLKSALLALSNFDQLRRQDIIILKR